MFTYIESRVRCDKCKMEDEAEIRHVSVFFHPPNCKINRNYIELGATGWTYVRGRHFCPKCTEEIVDLVEKYINNN